VPDVYDTLATIHDEIQLGEFASVMTPRLIDAAQRSGWMGRRILDLSCGSGISLQWLMKHGYLVTGVDTSEAMLRLARQRIEGDVTLKQQSILNLHNIDDMDMAIALDTLHELGSLRELENVFRQIHALLRDDKFFIFDMYTIEGLVQRYQSGDTIEHDQNGLLILTRNDYDYERQTQTRQYTILQRLEDTWTRSDTRRVLRAYPVQAIAALIKRCQYDIVRVFRPSMDDYKPGHSASRVIFMAQKSGG
jgi:SAM-dependent methyltransferase